MSLKKHVIRDKTDFLKQESPCWGLQISVGRPWLLARTTLGFFCLLHFIVFCVCLMERDVAADFDNRLIFSNTVGTNLFLWPLLRSGTSSSATLSFAKTNRRRGWDHVMSYFKVWTQIVWIFRKTALKYCIWNMWWGFQKPFIPASLVSYIPIFHNWPHHAIYYTNPVNKVICGHLIFPLPGVDICPELPHPLLPCHWSSYLGLP